MHLVNSKFHILIKPVVALLLALISVWVILLVAGYDAKLALSALYDASFKNPKALGTMLNRSCPLLFTGLAVAIAYRSNVLNIGAEGQFLAGTIAATWVGVSFASLPGFLLIPFMFLGGALAGAVVAYIPALLKIRLGVSEVITTIMFNYIFKYFVDALVRGPMKNTSQAEAQSWPIAEQAELTRLFPSSKLHIGFFLGILCAILLSILLFKTYFGYEIRAVGFNHNAAMTNGINVNRSMLYAMLLSGGLAGIAGTIEICNVHYLSAGISPGYGYTAIAVSLLANNHPIGIIFTSTIFGFLSAGSTAMQRVAGISSTFVQVFQGLIVIFVAIAAQQNSLRHKVKVRTGSNTGKTTKKEV